MKIIVTTLLSICVTTFAAVSDPSWSDSGIRGPKYAEILKTMDGWASSHPDLAQVVEYGRSVQGRPLRLMVVKKAGNFVDRPTLLMSGSTHGNEYLNIEDRLPEDLLKKAAAGDGNTIQRFVDAGGAFVFVPILNPDGYDNRERENAHGVDLNRDWDLAPVGFQGFKETETRALADQVEAFHRASDALNFQITVDYHCCAGALLYPWSYNDDKLPARDLARHQKFASLAANRLQIETGISGDILGYHSVGTTKDYYYVKYGAAAYTYEGRFNKERALYPEHLAWWTEMVQTLLTSRNVPLVTLNPFKRHPFVRLAD